MRSPQDVSAEPAELSQYLRYWIGLINKKSLIAWYEWQHRLMPRIRINALNSIVWSSLTKLRQQAIWPFFVAAARTECGWRTMFHSGNVARRNSSPGAKVDEGTVPWSQDGLFT